MERTVDRGDVVDEIAALKQQSGADILLVGSGDLLQTLMEHRLVDEYRFMVHPVVHGSGTQLFTGESVPTGLKLVETETTDSGVVDLTYEPAEEGEENQ